MEWIGVWHHDLSPYLIKFWEGFGIRWYGLSYLAGFLFGWLLLVYQHRKGWFSLPPARCLDAVLTAALCGVAGGRLGYVFFYNPIGFYHNPLYIFKIWQGGMSIFGGLLATVMALLWFASDPEDDLTFWELGDAGALATPPGIFFGRIANFVNGELWGRPTDGSWGVVFGRAEPPIPRHPSQLYEALGEGLLLFGLIWWVRHTTRRTGIASITFLGGYGVIRFLIEFYRAPDPHLGFDFLGLTRGQWFSLFAMIMAGLIYLGLYLGDSDRESASSLNP